MHLLNLSFDGRGGGGRVESIHLLKELFSQPKLGIVWGVYCLGVCSRGDQALKHPCKLRTEKIRFVTVLDPIKCLKQIR